MLSRPLAGGSRSLLLRIVIYTLLGGAVWWFTRVRITQPPRVADAIRRVEPTVQQLCQQAGVPYPPRQLFLRGFKQEKELEVWGGAKGEPLRLIKTYPVLAASGKPGPKRREGDRQVPEGFYRVLIFNPQSTYHLSLGLDYPNASDRVRSDVTAPGSDIYIHGSNASIGCLALGDLAIEEVYLLGQAAGGPGAKIPVHLFPARMSGPAWEQIRTAHPQHTAFWSELQPAFQAFESTRRVPEVEVTPTGAYQLKQR